MASWYEGTCFHKISQYIKLKHILSPIPAASCYVSAPSLPFSDATSLLPTDMKTLLNSLLRNAFVVTQIASVARVSFSYCHSKVLQSQGQFQSECEIYYNGRIKRWWNPPGVAGWAGALQKGHVFNGICIMLLNLWNVELDVYGLSRVRLVGFALSLLKLLRFVLRFASPWFVLDIKT